MFTLGHGTIYYEDEFLLVINKPAGMLSQPAGDGTPSLVEYLTGYLLDTGALNAADLVTFRPGVCNRLDRNTSGLVAAGKSLTGLQDLSAMFHNRNMEKFYLCLVVGVIKNEKYLIFIKKAIIEFNLLSLSYLLVNKFYISLYIFTPFVYNSFDNINTHKV